MFGHRYLCQLQPRQSPRHTSAMPCTRRYRPKRKCRLRTVCTTHQRWRRTAQRGMVCMMHWPVKTCDLHRNRRMRQSPLVHTYRQHTVSSQSSRHMHALLGMTRTHDLTRRQAPPSRIRL